VSLHDLQGVVLILSLVLLLLWPLRFCLRFRWQEGDQELMLGVQVIPGVAARLEIPLVRRCHSGRFPLIEALLSWGSRASPSTGQPVTWPDLPFAEALEEIFDKLRHSLKVVWPFVPVVHESLRIGTVTSLEVRTVLGLGDAAITAMAHGVAWALWGSALPFLLRYFSFSPGEPRFEAVPVYDQRRTELTVSGIFAIRVGHIMLAVLRALFKGASAVFTKRGGLVWLKSILYRD